MARTVSEIYNEIQAFSASDRQDLLRALIAELDPPADPNVEKTWLEEAQRRYRELVDRTVEGVPGSVAFERLRLRLHG